MLQKLQKLLAITAIVAMVTVFTPLMSMISTNAGTIDGAYVFLNRMEVGQTSGIEMVIAVTPTQSFATGSTVRLELNDTTGGDWCRTAGDLALDVTNITTSVVDQAGTETVDITAALPDGGAWAASCAAGAGGAGSLDTIEITNVGALTAGTTYGIRLSAGTTGVLGTNGDNSTAETTAFMTIENGTVTDSTALTVPLVTDATSPDGDQVEITAEVAAVPTITCSLSSNLVDLGTLYAGGGASSGIHTISTTTANTVPGYYWSAYGEGDGTTDAGLYDGSANLIASTGSATVDLTAGEGFGVVVSQEAGTTVLTDFQTGTLGQYGALDRALAGAQLVLYADGPVADGTDTATVTYGARAGTTAVAGTYTETVTWICGGYF